MKYKTTYFKISLNSEISVHTITYAYRLNNERLISDIKETEAKLKNDFKQCGIYLKMNELNISYLEEIQNPEHEIYQDRKDNYYKVSSNLSGLIIKKRQQRDLNNQRFTTDHEQELNNHLNEIAEDGWKLFSMNPIIKGYNDYNFSSRVESSYGYGFGHSVLEGFVLVWEKYE